MTNQDLPMREAKMMARFDDYTAAHKDNYQPFDKVIHELLKGAQAVVNEGPRFFYVIHEKMDGELSARYLNDVISANCSDLSVFLDAAFKGNRLSRCINKHKLKRVAKNQDLWHRIPLTKGTALLALAAWVVSIGIALATLFVASSAAGNRAVDILRSYHIERILFPLWIFCCAFSLLLVRKLSVDQDKIAFEELDKAIESMSDARFLIFLENFSAEDFRFVGLNRHQEGIHIICPLTRYNLRQRAILKRYWMTTSTRERWWIFTEQRADNIHYILDKSNRYERYFIYLRPLRLKAKRALAEDFGRDVHDPGLRHYGIDYIASSLLHIGINIPDTTLSQRLNDFVAREQGNFPVSIRAVIYLVAELSVKYRIDFTSGKYWEYLFEYPTKSDKLIELDRQVSKEYFSPGTTDINVRDLNSLRHLIPLILQNFFDDLGTIASECMPQVQLSYFTLLCLIKALRCRKEANDERTLAIAETLYDTLGNAEVMPETFCKRAWIDVFTEALSFFKEIHYGCFSPAFLHAIINIYDKSKDRKIEKLFSLPVVLWTAKANLQLNNSTNVYDELSGQAIDVIYDHFRITNLALQARGKANFPIRSTSLPESFGLLNLTQLQRQNYFYALETLGEQDILTHYDLLYDIYCITVISMHDQTNFVRSLFQKRLNERYGYVMASSCDSCLKKALHSIANQLKSIYSDNPLVSQDLPCLIGLIDEESDKNVGESLFYLAKWEVHDFVIGSFIACMVCHMNKNLKNYRDVYLNMGSYLVRNVFLTHFESREDSFQNNDFQYLVRILTDYQDPCLAVLTHLAFLGQHPTPAQAKRQIAEYLAIYKMPFCQNLLSIQKNLEENEIETYISYVELLSFGLSSGEKKPLYTAMQSLLTERYTQAPFASILNELLRYYIDGQFSQEFLSCSHSCIIDQLSRCSPETVCLLFYELIRYDKGYLILCPNLVESLLESKFAIAPTILIGYLFWEREENSCTNEYIDVAKAFYNHCYFLFSTHALIAEREDLIRRYTSALRLLANNYNETPDYYDWIDITVVAAIIARLNENLQYLFEVAAQIVFRERKWGRNGLLVYLKYILTNAPFPPRDVPAYECLNELSKPIWLEENITSIRPLIYDDGRCYVNTTYIALLDLFLKNEGNIQDRKSEFNIHNRVAADAQQIIPTIFKNDKERCARIQNMITDYCDAIMT